jgi:hypothetical protein
MSSDPSVKDMVAILSKLPPPPPVSDTDVTRESILLQSQKVECSCLQKHIPVSDVRRIHTGALDAIDTTCKDCLKDVHDLSVVVCCRCRRVISRFTPFSDPTNGFQFEKGKAYHVESCPRCEPGITESVIIEKYIHDMERN